MRAIDDDLQIAQIKTGGHGAFTEFNITTGGVIDAARAPQIFGFDGLHGFAVHLINGGFDGAFYVVGQLFAVGRKELDAIIFKGIMRRRDDHTGLQTQGACEVSDTGRGQRPGQVDIDPGG